MKAIISNRKQGSVLLVTMVFVLTLAAALYGYLALVQNSQLGVARAQTWNSSLPIAEAGIDEGMAKLNTTVGIDNTNIVGGFDYTLNRSLNGANYNVIFRDYGNFQRFLYATGIVSAPISGDNIIRTVKVGVQRQAVFSKGMVAVDFINMNGNSIASDSFNSHDTNQSVNGAYSSSYYSGSDGDIAAVNGYVNLGNQTIQGDLFLGPNATYDGSGTITGTTYYDANLQYDTFVVPSGIAWSTLPSPTTVTNSKGNKTYPAYVFTAPGNYQVWDNNVIVVSPGVKVTLDIKTSGWNPAAIDIQGGMANSGSAVLYVESGDITLNGNLSGGASSSRPENLYVFATKGVTSITLGGTTDFIGVIYAPDSTLKLNGGGSSDLNLTGSVVVKSVTMGGHYKFHYDTSLAYSYWGVYVVGSWQEL